MAPCSEQEPQHGHAIGEAEQTRVASLFQVDWGCKKEVLQQQSDFLGPVPCLEEADEQLAPALVPESPLASTCPGSSIASSASTSSSEDSADIADAAENADGCAPLDAATEGPNHSSCNGAPDSPTRPTKNFGLLVALTIFFGCACQAPYEVLNSSDKGCAPLISLIEHLFGIAASLGALSQRRHVSWSVHIGLAATNVGYTLLLNVALCSALPTTVLIAMKNGNLVANMLLGVGIMHYRYAVGQYGGVALISAGLVLTSLAGAQTSSGVSQSAAALTVGSTAGGSRISSAGLGLLCIVGALLSRAASGMLQEVRCRGAPVTELLLFRSALGLPLLFCQWPQIVHHFTRWTYGDAMPSLAWPTPWILLMANIGFDYGTKVCISQLIERTSSLTATLVLTVQRFMSFCLSATLLGKEQVGRDLWLGAVVVLGGTLMYTLAQDRLAIKAKTN